MWYNCFIKVYSFKQEETYEAYQDTN